MRIILIGLGLCLCFIARAQESKSFPLFEEGRDGWIQGGDASWTFESGVLSGDASGDGGFVMTTGTYSDFELHLEFKPDPEVNSGVFVRCSDKLLSNRDCYEINIWDLHPDQSSRTGSVVTRSPPMAHVDTNGKWNTYKIRCTGNRIQAWVNGVLTADIMDEDLSSGYIALQAASAGRIAFRNIQLYPISQE